MHVIDRMLEAAGLEIMTICPCCRKALKPQTQMVCPCCAEYLEIKREFEEDESAPR